MKSRRTFFSSVAGSILVTLDELRGRPQHKLDGLSSLTEEELKRIIPRVVDKRYFSVEEGKLWKKDPKTGRVQLICNLGGMEQKIFERFSERKSVGEISEWVARSYHMSLEEGFGSTKGLLLRLIQKQVCLPINSRV